MNKFVLFRGGGSFFLRFFQVRCSSDIGLGPFQKPNETSPKPNINNVNLNSMQCLSIAPSQLSTVVIYSDLLSDIAVSMWVQHRIQVGSLGPRWK